MLVIYLSEKNTKYLITLIDRTSGQDSRLAPLGLWTLSNDRVDLKGSLFSGLMRQDHISQSQCNLDENGRSLGGCNNIPVAIR